MKPQILKKDSHKSFSYLAGINRPINPSQVTKLAESVNKLGILRPVIVAEISFLTGKKTNYIIDGQHLFNALLRNNMDIPFISIKIDTKVQLVESIALLNASSKNWAMIDYITSEGISVNVHFIPMPMLTVFKNLGYDIKDYPVSYDNYSREISLPIYPQLTQMDLERICMSIEASYKICLNEKAI
jgi:hypothetical protein